MKKIFLPVTMLFLSVVCRAQTYYCPLHSLNGVTTKTDQWFVVNDAVSIKTTANGKTDSLHFKKIASTNPAVIYFIDGEITSSLTLVHSPGTMKGTAYTDVVSLKKDLRAEATEGLWYCTVVADKR